MLVTVGDTGGGQVVSLLKITEEVKGVDCNVKRVGDRERISGPAGQGHRILEAAPALVQMALDRQRAARVAVGIDSRIETIKGAVAGMLLQIVEARCLFEMRVGRHEFAHNLEGNPQGEVRPHQEHRVIQTAGDLQQFLGALPLLGQAFANDVIPDKPERSHEQLPRLVQLLCQVPGPRIALFRLLGGIALGGGVNVAQRQLQEQFSPGAFGDVRQPLGAGRSWASP